MKQQLTLDDIVKLRAISPIDGRYRERLTDLWQIFSEDALMYLRVLVEGSWLRRLIIETKCCKSDKAQQEIEDFIAALIDNFGHEDSVNIRSIEGKTHHDVKAIEYFIREKLGKRKQFQQYRELVHFGITSDDVNNLAYALMLDQARTKFLLPELGLITEELRSLAHKYAATPMLSRTHGQPATPTTVGKECAIFVARLEDQQQALKVIPAVGKFNGATGNYSALYAAYPEHDWRTICQKFVNEFEITCNLYTTQIEPHDTFAEFCHIVAHTNTILIGLCRDIWGYISLNYFVPGNASENKGVKKVKNGYQEIGSSTMPHKINPIDFENAEGNLGVANALLYHFATKLPISRWQRDLSDSTVMRNFGSAIAYSLIAYSSLLKGLKKLEVNQTQLASDLDQHWEVLGEAIQMTMRRYNIPNSYEQLKELTRGKKVTPQLLHNFIKTLAIPDEAKSNLLKLTPHSYLGKAVELAQEI